MAKATKIEARKKKPVLAVVYIILIIVFASTSAYFAVRYFQVNNKYKAAIMTQEEKNKKVVAKIAKLIDLPKDKTPEVAILADKDKISSSPTVKAFYASAEKGDYVVAFKDTNQTIIYRDSTNKIVKTGEYIYYSAASSAPIKIAILAPTEQQASIEKEVTDKILNVSVVAKDTPKSSSGLNYVADVTGSNEKTAKELADRLGLTVGQLPEGESKPDGATLIIVIGGQASQ